MKQKVQIPEKNVQRQNQRGRNVTSSWGWGEGGTLQSCGSRDPIHVMCESGYYTVKIVTDFPVPRWDVTNQTHPGQE
jgi:hypothetical protein